MDRALILQGRDIRPEDVALIGDWLQTHPGWNRTRLSRELCVSWNWRNEAGRLKDMAAPHAPLRAIVLGDDIYSHQPFCRRTLLHGFDFIFVCPRCWPP